VIYGAIASTIYFLKAIAITVSLDLWAIISIYFFKVIASTIYFLKAIAIFVRRDLWGDRINNLFFKGDRYYCEL
jgi:hypothetical protein